MRADALSCLIAFTAGVGLAYWWVPDQPSSTSGAGSSLQTPQKTDATISLAEKKSRQLSLARSLLSPASLLEATQGHLSPENELEAQLRLATLADQDPEKAYQTALESETGLDGDEDRRRRLCRTVLEVVADRHGPERALEVLKTTREEDYMLISYGVNLIYSDWITEDPGAAARSIDTLPPHFWRETSDLRGRIFDAWPDDDLINGFLVYVRIRGPSPFAPPYKHIDFDWQRTERLTDALTPEMLIKETKSESERTFLSSILLSKNLRKAPFSLVHLLPDSDRFQFAIQFASDEMLGESPVDLDRLKLFLNELDEGRHRQELKSEGSNLAWKYHSEYPPPLPAPPVFNLMPKDFQLAFLENLAVFSSPDRIHELAWILSLTHPDVQRRAMESFVTTTRDGTMDLLKWILRLRPLEWSSYGGVNREELQNTPPLAWPLELLPGPLRDGSLSALVLHRSTKAPATAVQLAAQIQDPLLRKRRLRLALRHLIAKDSTAGRQAIEAAKLSAHAKQSLRSRLPNP